nr:MAG TPA: hypothetical protein [Caudoviricetes sp.]
MPPLSHFYFLYILKKRLNRLSCFVQKKIRAEINPPFIVNYYNY